MSFPMTLPKYINYGVKFEMIVRRRPSVKGDLLADSLSRLGLYNISWHHSHNHLLIVKMLSIIKYTAKSVRY